MATGAKIDYAALARQAGAVESASGKPDYAALAAQSGAVQSTTADAPKITPPSPPGFLTRLGQSLGIPTSKAEFDAAVPDNFAEALNPIVWATKAGQSVAGGIKRNEAEFEEAVQNIKEGGPIGANLGKAALAVEKGTLEGPLSLVGGQAVQNFGEDVAKGNYSGAAGGALGTLGQAALLKMGGKERAPETRVNKLSYAIGASGEKINYPEALKTALPELDRAASSLSQPVETIGDLHQVVKEAFRQTENEFNTALHPISRQPVIPTNIAADIRAQAQKLNPKNSVEARMRNMLLNRATEFDQPWTLGELNQQRMNANGRLTAFENASQSGQQASLRTKADVMVDKAIRDGSMDIVYDAMEQHYGKDFRALKQRQSAMTVINDRVNAEMANLANAAAANAGEPLLASRNASVYGHPSGHLGISFHRLQNFIMSPAKAANRAVKTAFSETSTLPRLVPYTLPARKALFTSEYDTPEKVMLAMKSGELGQKEGNTILQRMKGKSGVVTRPLAPPE